MALTKRKNPKTRYIHTYIHESEVSLGYFDELAVLKYIGLDYILELHLIYNFVWKHE